MRNVLICCFALSVLLPFAARGQQVTVAVSGTLTDPVACEGVVYFGSDNGKLYAVNAADGSAVPGFPVDIGAAMGDGSYLEGRPGVYYGAYGKAIYLETSKHGIAKVWPNGAVAWTNKLDSTSRVGGYATPAVTSDGDVIAEMKTSTSVYIVKLRESDGERTNTSPALSTSYFDFLSPPAVVGDNIYTSVRSPPNGRDILVLNRSDLSVKASLKGSQADWSPPYVRGPDVFIGSSAFSFAAVSKFNAVTLTPDNSFGTAGEVTFDTSGYGAYLEVSASPRSADRDAGGTIYASIQNSIIARVVGIDATTGSVRSLYSTGTNGAGGMVVSPHHVIAYGDAKTLNLFSIDGGGLRTYALSGRPQRPTYDSGTDRFFASTIKNASGMSYLVGFDSR